MNWTKVGLKGLEFGFVGRDVLGLNWTKVGLKAVFSICEKAIIDCLNWTKVGLKEKDMAPGGEEDVWFELD